MCSSRFLIALVLCVASVPFAAGQQSDDIQNRVRAYRIAHEQEIVQEFKRLLSLPNHATDIPDMERNAELIKTMLERRGVTVRMLRVPGAPPIVLGELRARGASRTIGIYAHYDGQPVDPGEWRTPPFSPVIRDQNGRDVDWETATQFDPEWRIYARSASDEKAPIEATVAAIDALRASNTPLAVNVKFNV